MLAVTTPEQKAEIAKISVELQDVAGKIAAREEELKRQPPQPKQARGRILEIKEAKAEKQTLAKIEGGALLASGDNPDKDTYTLVLGTDLEKIASFKLDALAHPSMTSGRLSRSDSGNFVLTGVEIALKRKGEQQFAPLKIASSQATFEQGDHKVERSYDGRKETGWAVWDGKGANPASAVYRLAKPVDVGEGGQLSVILRHESPHKNHNLGHFRLSASPDADALLPGVKPVDPVIAALSQRRGDLEGRRDNLTRSAPKVMVMADQGNRRDTFILHDGLYNQRGEKVGFGTPAALPPLPKGAPENRLGLAQWLVAPETHSWPG